MQASERDGKSLMARQCILAGLIAMIFLITFADAVSRGLHAPLPGSMSRSRDSIAVAITYVQYGLWDGYASYRRVNTSLFDSGLSVHQAERKQAGLPGYVDIMLSPPLLRSALADASSLEDPASDGLFFMQDEKGLAVLYILAFTVFGIAVESWFYLYMLLLGISLLLAAVTFRNHLEALLFFLVYSCAHYAMLLIIPEMPRQDINFVHGNRFLGIMAAVPMFHVMFLLLYRIRASFLTLSIASFQVVLLMLVINARTSVFWAVQAIILLAFMMWLRACNAANSRSIFSRMLAATMRLRRTSWPLGLLALGMVALLLHQRYGLHDFYRTPQGQIGRVFWHNVTTALANHPARAEHLGIPAGMPAYDDQVGYLLFYREVERRGESGDQYIIGDRDWRYRTSDIRFDFRWGTYDLVLRDVVLRMFAEDPRYVLEALFIYQPLSVLKLLVSPALLRWGYLLSLPIVLALAAGSLMVPARQIARLFPAWAAACIAVFGPLLVAAVIELRIADIFFLVTLGAGVLLCAAVSYLARALGGLHPARTRQSQHPT